MYWTCTGLVLDLYCAQVPRALRALGEGAPSASQGSARAQAAPGWLKAVRHRAPNCQLKKRAEKADFAELSCCEKLADVLRFAANRGLLLLVVRACFDLTKQMLRETTREGKKRGSVSSSGAPAKRPHAKRALAENGDLRGHEELGLHIRSPKKLISLVDTHMEMTRFFRRFDWRAQIF